MSEISDQELNDLIRELEELRKLVTDTLNDEDFQPLYSQRNFMCGSALRGTLEQIQDATARMLRARGVEIDDG